LFPDGQVAVVSTLGAWTAVWVAAGSSRLGLLRVVELIGAIAGGLLLGPAPKGLRLQLAVLPLEVLVGLFQGPQTANSIRMPALPIARLLPQFEVFASQARDFVTQDSHFLAELRQ
jgi:hypothetical protein